MDQLVCASLSHSHYRHEVGMLEVSVTLYTNINHYAGIQKIKNQTRSSLESSFCTLRCVCVCVFFPFILDFNGRTSRGHTGGRSHRIFHPPSLCGACLNFSREKDPAIPYTSSTVKSNFVY